MKHKQLARLLLISIMLTGLAPVTLAQTDEDYQDIKVSVIGTGPDLIFIPGLNSGADTFTEVCDALKNDYRCHLLQLPGFAGAAPIANVESGFLEPMLERIIAYVRDRGLEKPVIVGHSLGGFLALLIAEQEPELARGLIIVDSLPYLPAGQNPMATVELMRPMAEQLKTGMLALSDAQFEQQTQMQLMGMTNVKERMPQLVAWGISSDRTTMAQAMYEMQTTDLRPRMGNISTPTLILGAWAAYESFGSTKAITQGIFDRQYQLMPNKKIVLSDTGYHFLMWDDPQWLLDQVEIFLTQL